MKKLLLILTLFLIPILGFCTTYYPKSTGNLYDLATWGTATNGTSTTPSSFINTTDVFIVNANKTVDGVWTVSNLTVNIGVTLTLSATTTVKGILILSGGNNIASNGYLILDLNTGSISSGSMGNIIGDITVTKNINSKGWHYIGTPLSGVTVAQFDDNSSANNFYYYDETNTSVNYTDGWVRYNNLSSPVNISKGYILYYFGNGIIDLTGGYNHNFIYDIQLTYTNAVDNDTDGWNLISNPFLGTLDWDAQDGWTKPTSGSNRMDNAIYFWDAVNKRYVSYIDGQGANGGTRYIPSLQSYWVKYSKNNNGNNTVSPLTLSVDKRAIVNTTNPALWRLSANNTDIVRIGAKSKTKPTDETVLRILDIASDTFDGDFDAYKMMNLENTPSLWTKLDSTNYSINSLSDTINNYKDIPLYFKCSQSDTFTLEFNNTLGSQYKLLLLDSIENTSQEIINDESYTFVYNIGERKDRFVLRIVKEQIITSTNQNYNNSNLDVKITTDNSNISIMNPSNYDIKIYNLNGQLIHTSNESNINVNSNIGINIVQITSPTEINIRKILVK
jgi:hypothetical protein